MRVDRTWLVLRFGPPAVCVLSSVSCFASGLPEASTIGVIMLTLAGFTLGMAASWFAWVRID